jgi:hypothetical protein
MRAAGAVRGWAHPVQLVMPGLVPGIHVFLFGAKEDVDGRDKPGHDVVDIAPYFLNVL